MRAVPGSHFGHVYTLTPIHPALEECHIALTLVFEVKGETPSGCGLRALRPEQTEEFVTYVTSLTSWR